MCLARELKHEDQQELDHDGGPEHHATPVQANKTVLTKRTARPGIRDRQATVRTLIGRHRDAPTSEGALSKASSSPAQSAGSEERHWPRQLADVSAPSGNSRYVVLLLCSGMDDVQPSRIADSTIEGRETCHSITESLNRSPASWPLRGTWTASAPPGENPDHRKLPTGHGVTMGRREGSLKPRGGRFAEYPLETLLGRLGLLGDALPCMHSDAWEDGCEHDDQVSRRAQVTLREGAKDTSGLPSSTVYRVSGSVPEECHAWSGRIRRPITHGSGGGPASTPRKVFTSSNGRSRTKAVRNGRESVGTVPHRSNPVLVDLRLAAYP